MRQLQIIDERASAGTEPAALASPFRLLQFGNAVRRAGLAPRAEARAIGAVHSLIRKEQQDFDCDPLSSVPRQDRI